MKISFILYTVACLLVSGSAFADFRIWEDKNGNRYDAEFVRELFGKMTLRTRDGKDVVIPVEDFSEHDQKYLRVMVPPELSLKVDVKSVRRKDPYEGWNRTYVLTDTMGVVSIEQKSKRAFTSRLTAEIFLIAEELDGKNFVLMSRTEDSFLLGGPGVVHQFATDKVLLIESGATFYTPFERGARYVGYLLVISDAQGNICQIDTDLRKDWIRSEKVVRNLRDLMVRGAGSMFSRHFDMTGQKVEVPRRPYIAPAR